MGNLRFSKALPEHVDALEAGLRRLDRQEVEASAGDVRAALENAVALSDDPVALHLPTGQLVALFGTAPLTMVSDTGAIWLLGTDHMRAHPREIIAATLRYIAFIRERYPRLVNYVDARNRPSIRWLRSVGFTLDPPIPHGVAGLPFHRFHMGLDDV